MSRMVGGVGGMCMCMCVHVHNEDERLEEWPKKHCCCGCPYAQAAKMPCPSSPHARSAHTCRYVHMHKVQAGHVTHQMTRNSQHDGNKQHAASVHLNNPSHTPRHQHNRIMHLSLHGAPASSMHCKPSCKFVMLAACFEPS